MRGRAARGVRRRRRRGRRGRSDRGNRSPASGTPGESAAQLGAAPGLFSLRSLILNEPSLGLRYPSGSIDVMAELVAADDVDGAVVAMLRAVIGLTADEIAERRAEPTRSERLAAAPTMIREARIEESWIWETERFATISVPTLLLTGSKTTSDLAEVTRRTAAAIPGARVHLLRGHGHLAHRSDPATVAQAYVRGFGDPVARLSDVPGRTRRSGEAPTGLRRGLIMAHAFRRASGPAAPRSPRPRRVGRGTRGRCRRLTCWARRARRSGLRRSVQTATRSARSAVATSTRVLITSVNEAPTSEMVTSRLSSTATVCAA